jgi:hypothetical protein
MHVAGGHTHQSFSGAAFCHNFCGVMIVEVLGRSHDREFLRRERLAQQLLDAH